MEKLDLLGLSFEELAEYIKSIGESAFRAGQVYGWLARGVDFDDMTNLSKALRVKLADTATANSVKLHSVYTSQTDDTQKILFELSDANIVEGVLMRYHHGNTLCLSTQVGCRMGCAFCASTLNGRVRDLKAGEMAGQVLIANKALHMEKEGARVSNIVLMGSGEPFDNYDEVVKFIRLVTDERGLNQSMRGISLSTCGLVPEMMKFAEEGLHVTLSVSLHAPNDEIREKIMPVAKAYPMDKIIDASRNYVRKTGRRVIFEYALIDGINCELRHADELAGKLRNLQCHVNVIPLNAVSENPLKPPERQAVDAFLGRLADRHISATRRREMGTDIQGACGQLRRRVLQGDGT